MNMLERTRQALLGETPAPTLKGPIFSVAGLKAPNPSDDIEGAISHAAREATEMNDRPATYVESMAKSAQEHSALLTDRLTALDADQKATEAEHEAALQRLEDERKELISIFDGAIADFEARRADINLAMHGVQAMLTAMSAVADVPVAKPVPVATIGTGGASGK